MNAVALRRLLDSGPFGGYPCGAMTRRSVAAVAALAIVLGGCTSVGQREAASLVSAVDAYRHAPAPVRAQRGRDVSDVACTDAKVCDAKQACVAAIEPTVRALALKDEVSASVASIEKGTLAKDSPEAQALPGKLDEAEHLLTDGRAKMQTCDARLTDLHVAFGV
jgi:hypothetical protein